MPLLKRYALLPLFIALLVALLLGAYVAVKSRTAYSLAHIERADTPAAQELGLGGRADIPADYGMLFVFPSDGDYAFWMKDMLVPIDIIWLAGDGQVLGIENAVATSTYPHAFHPPQLLRYVLETRAGTARARGWVTGTVLSLPL